MDEKKRTMVLAGVLAVVLVIVFFRPHEKLMEPIRKAENRLDDANTAFEKERDKETEMMLAQKRISDGRKASLPPRATDAQRVYQTWITNLGEQCRFAQLQVTPANKGNYPNQYSTVDIDVTAEADLERLSLFLYLFEQAHLMHRITFLEVESTGSSGTPRLEITMTVQGLSVAGCPQKSDVFALTKLPEDIAADATEIVVAEAGDFPKESEFLAQVGRELIRVTGVSENKWTVIRGLNGTEATAHSAQEVVQLFPVAPARQDIKFAGYQAFLDGSPFIKPAPPKVYRPRLASLTDKTIQPGDTVEMTARAEDLNPDVGKPVFGLKDAVDGMTIDPETGNFKWETSEDLEPKRYEVTFLLTQDNNPELQEEKKIGITARLPNEAPTLTVPENAIVVLGRDFSLETVAEDDGPEDGLKFSLDGDTPEGLSIDEASGTLTWNPPITFEPGEYQVTVKVTDSSEPALSDSESVTLTVKDDDAVLTRFTGSVTLDGTPVAWFRNTGTRQRPELKIGDSIVAAEISARLTEISARHVLLADAEGIWKLNLGDNLRQRVLIEAAKEEAADESEASAENVTAVTDEKPKTDYDADPPTEDKPSEDVEEKPVVSEDKEAGESVSDTSEPTTAEVPVPAADRP